MSKVYEEIDFFEMEKWKASSKPPSPERAANSFRGIQSVVSRINPQLLKTVMAAGHAGPSENSAYPWGKGKLSQQLSSHPPSPTPAVDESRSMAPPPSSLPVFNPVAPQLSPSPLPPTAPLTIFYNGTVVAVDLPHDKAEFIMRMAETGTVGNPVETPQNCFLHGDQQEGDLPIARSKSLQRFLEKRKQRLVAASPYRHVTTSHR